MNLNNPLRTKQISKLLGEKTLYFSDFLHESKYTLEQIQSINQKQDIVAWRYVGMVWYRLCGKTLEETAAKFQRDHSTVVHAEKRILAYLEMGQDYSLKKPVDLMMLRAQEPLHLTEYHEKNIQIVLAKLENNLFKRANNMTRENLFPAYKSHVEKHGSFLLKSNAL